MDFALESNDLIALILYHTHLAVSLFCKAQNVFFLREKKKNAHYLRVESLGCCRFAISLTFDFFLTFDFSLLIITFTFPMTLSFSFSLFQNDVILGQTDDILSQTDVILGQMDVILVANATGADTIPTHYLLA